MAKRTNNNNRRKKPRAKLSDSMRKKLIVLFTIISLCLCALVGELIHLNYTKGEEYEKKVLAMQGYDSQTIPYQRGDIVDRNGTVLATSVAVYNVILDCSIMTSTMKVDGEAVQKYIEPTIDALIKCFPELDKEKLYQYATEQSDSKYIILLKKLPYNEIQQFVEMQEAVDEDNKKINPNIKGVWFEKEYIRSYPFQSMASSVIGFTSSGNVGTIGLENYYNSVLNGINGRKYGYLNSESDFEKTVIAPQDGNTLVTTIDANIQAIVEKKILEYNMAYKNNYLEGNGSLNTAVLIMNPNTGAVLAMAEYPNFDLNNPRDPALVMTEEELENATQKEKMDALNELWRNYCVTETYEPGSVQKPFTIAGGLETGKLNTDMCFVCDGFEVVGGSRIRCVNRTGHGTETLEKSIMDSCNDALMQMADLIGISTFCEYQSIFGFGQKTGIDLPGEANTAGLIYTKDKMKPVDLATNSFGQNYNCTMIQMASAFCSLINGGTYYQPYLVSKIMDANGGTVSVTEPTVLKQTVSQKTSDLLRGYMYKTVSVGTAKTAKVDGYSMGGKTGTAEKLPRGNKKYVVSFLGFAPYENPELVIYCTVDEPNSKNQAYSAYAQTIVREILEEVLPYMNIYQDEELTGINEGLDITGTDPNFNGERDGNYLNDNRPIPEQPAEDNVTGNHGTGEDSIVEEGDILE